MPDTFTKDPSAVLDYSVTWAAWLIAGDTVTEAVWTVPDGLVKDRESRDGPKATVWLGGGVEGAKYTVGCKITTAAGRTDERSIKLTIKQR